MQGARCFPMSDPTEQRYTMKPAPAARCASPLKTVDQASRCPRFMAEPITEIEGKIEVLFSQHNRDFAVTV
jgi:predicted Zn-ribbon and HTH transcriptional regulator